MPQSNTSGDLFENSDSNDTVVLNEEQEPTKENAAKNAAAFIEISEGKMSSVNSAVKTLADNGISVDKSSASSVKSGDSDSRPMCRYGSQCYRKNPLHFTEFRHPEKEVSNSIPQPKRRKLESSNSGASEGKSSTEKEISIGIPEPKRLKLEPSNSGASEGKSATDDSNKSVSTSDYDKKCGAEMVEDAKPFSFLLTKVAGIPKRLNSKNAIHNAIHIKEILCPSLGDLIRSAQFNYCIDIPWVVSQYPEHFRSRPLLIVHGAQKAEKAELDISASAFSHVKLCQAPLEMSYGTHHTKMMLLEYDTGLRVVIHTSNLRSQDWFQKTQGVWISPLFKKLSGSMPSTGPAVTAPAVSGDSVTNFKRDLIAYLLAYGRQKSLEEWINIIREYDMSEVRVYLIGSVPGRHSGERKSQFGHLKLRKILREHCISDEVDSSWPVIGQFSSVGTLGAKAESWMCGELLESLSAVSSKKAASSFLMAKPRLQLIFPTKENVRTSLEGYMAGASIPYSKHTAVKQPYFNTFLHQWKAACTGRSRAAPHIKTYTRVSPDYKKIAWFLVTSANMSKAAWGALEKNDSQLMIRSYELGVLFLPQSFESGNVFHTQLNSSSGSAEVDSSDSHAVFPVPYDLPLTPYEKEDKPWIWDIPYTDLPDSHGNQWSPS